MAINRLIGFGPRNGEREPGTGELCDLPGQREYPRTDHNPGSHRHSTGEGQTVLLVLRRAVVVLQWKTSSFCQEPNAETDDRGIAAAETVALTVPLVERVTIRAELSMLLRGASVRPSEAVAFIRLMQPI